MIGKELAVVRRAGIKASMSALLTGLSAEEKAAVLKEL